MSDDFSLEDDLEDLVSAEDFLEYFDIEFEPSVVHVNRLHILQRFHDYIDKWDMSTVDNEESKREIYVRLLTRAYQDFVESDSYTEKVFKVFHMHEPQSTFVSIDNILK